MSESFEEELECIRKNYFWGEFCPSVKRLCFKYVENGLALHKLQKVLRVVHYNGPIKCDVCRKIIVTPLAGGGGDLITKTVLDTNASTIECIINEFQESPLPIDTTFFFNHLPYDYENEIGVENSIIKIADFIEEHVMICYVGKMICYMDTDRIYKSTKVYIKQREEFNRSFTKGWTTFMNTIKAKDVQRKLGSRLFTQLKTMPPIGPLLCGGVEYQKVAATTMYRQV